MVFRTILLVKLHICFRAAETTGWIKKIFYIMSFCSFLGKTFFLAQPQSHQIGYLISEQAMAYGR